MTSNQSLEGITVIDCSQILAGPFCSMLLADHGARVIKVEKPNGGDDVRTWGPPFIGSDSSAFVQLNRNKELMPSNWGWYQVLSKPYGDIHTSVHGFAQEIK